MGEYARRIFQKKKKKRKISNALTVGWNKHFNCSMFSKMKIILNWGILSLFLNYFKKKKNKYHTKMFLWTFYLLITTTFYFLLCIFCIFDFWLPNFLLKCGRFLVNLCKCHELYFKMYMLYVFNFVLTNLIFWMALVRLIEQ